MCSPFYVLLVLIPLDKGQFDEKKVIGLRPNCYMFTNSFVNNYMNGSCKTYYISKGLI